MRARMVLVLLGIGAMLFVGGLSWSFAGDSADLVVVSLDAPDTAVEGESIWVSGTIENQGDQITENTFYVHFYLSEDKTITSSDIYIDQMTYTHMLAPGETSSFGPANLAEVTPGITGTYYVGAIVDATGTVQESNENNNTGYDPTPINITPAPTTPTTAKVHTSHWYPETKPAEMAEYGLELTVRGEGISTVTVEGPNIPLTHLEYEETMDTGEWRWTKHVGLPGRPSVGDTYNFHVTYNDLTTEDLTASVTGVIDEFPTIVSPVHGSTITTTTPKFEWSALTIELRSLGIIVVDPEAEKLMWMPEVSEEATSVVYNFDGTGEPLQVGKSYMWILLYRDALTDNGAFVLSEFTVGSEATTPTISGNISYIGISTGTIYVAAFTDPTFSGEPAAYVKLGSPGSYTITGLADGTYYVLSVMTIGHPDSPEMTDPWGVYGTLENPTPVIITEGSSESGIDITLVDGTEENPNPFYEEEKLYPVGAWSQNWSYGEQYMVHFEVEDPDHEATSVEITGPGIIGSLSLDYDNNEKAWNSWHTDKSLDFGSSPPTPPLTYTFTIVDPSTTTVKTDKVESFVSVYATNLSPSGVVSADAPLVFSWTGVGAGYTYSVELNDAAGNWVWDAYDLTTTSVSYDGPALTPGAEYSYWVVVEDEYGNSSFAEESFVYRAAGTGLISGTVKDYLGNPVNGARIEIALSKYPDDPEGCIDVVSTVFSGTEGAYSTSVPEGTYRVLRCWPPTGTELAVQWAEYINVTAGGVTTVNFTLPLGGTIEGKVTDTAGNPLEGIGLQVNAPEGHYRFCGTGTQTDISGAYSLPNIPEGIWGLGVEPPEGSPYADKKVTDISVTPGQTTTVNITLLRGGWVSGRVVDYNNSPVANAEIDLWSEVGNAHAETDKNGNYTTDAVPPGVYSLRVQPPEERTDLATASFEDIEVVEDLTTRVDVTLLKAWSIRGAVTPWPLGPLAPGTIGYFVMALPSDLVIPPIENFETLATMGEPPMASVESDGTYELTGSLSGTYDISLWCGKMSQEWFEHMTVIGSVLNVSVTAGEITSGQNIAATIGAASLTGTIISSDGGYILHAIETGKGGVFVSDVNGKLSAVAVLVGTDSRVDQGSYRIDNLPAGTYNLMVLTEGYQPILETVEIGTTEVVRDYTLYPTAEPRKGITLISDDPKLSNARYITTDGINLYVTNAGADVQSILSIPIEGGTVTTLYDAAGYRARYASPHGITLIGTDLIWIDPQSGPITDTQILKAPKDGSGPITAIYTGRDVGEPIVDGTGLTTDGVKLYSADAVQGRVHSLNPDGSELTQLDGIRYGGYFDTEHLNTIAESGGILYIADGGKEGVISPQVVTISTSGGSFTTLFAGAPLVSPMDITVGNDIVFVADPRADNTIWSLPISTGGKPTVVVSGSPFVDIRGLTFFDNALYVIDAAGAIYKVDITPELVEQPDISVEPASYDLSLSAGASATQELTLSNTGQADLTYQVEEEIDWLTVSPTSGTVVPGGSEKLTLTFDATSLTADTYEDQITIASNDPDEATVAVQVKLTVIAKPQADIGVVVTSPQFVGQEFWAEVQVGEAGKPVKDLFGVSFVLNYTNTDIIDALEVESTTGQLVLGLDVVAYSDIDDPNGQVSVGVSRKAGAGGFDGYGAVARVKFKFLSNAAEGQVVDLTLSNVLANDPTGASIFLVPVSGQVTAKAGLLVWPGDTDNNGLVDQGDILPIGLYWHSTGPARSEASLSWEVQVATPWSPEAATYADADGNGLVDQGEILAIGLNWHKTHAGGTAKPVVDIFDPSMDHSRYLTQYRMMCEALKNSPETEGVVELRQILAQLIELALPKQDMLGQNFPNPFNAFTRIEYQLSRPIHVKLAVYDLLGQEVRTLVDENKDAGFYTIIWDGRDNSGQAVGSGTYLYRMVKGEFVRTKRMLLIR